MLFYYKNSLDNSVLIQSDIDGEYYYAHNTFDAKESVNLMAQLNARGISLLKWLAKKKPDDEQFKKLISRYNYQKMMENSPHNFSRTSSYMKHKGKVFAICLRRKDGTLYPFDILFFVFLHELSHLMIDEYEHPPSYWVAFKKLLGAAKESGTYMPIDFQKYPIEYGGQPLTYNPYFDFDL